MATAKMTEDDGTRRWYELNGMDYGTGREFENDLYAVTKDGTILDSDGYPLTDGDGETIAVRNAISAR